MVSFFTRTRQGPRVRLAAADDLAPALDFLDRKPAEHVFLSYLVRRDRFAHNDLTRCWYLVWRDGRVRGVCLVASNLIPAADDEDAARALAQAVGSVRSGTHSLVGERTVVNALWEGLGGRAPAVRLVREQQPLYVIGRGTSVAVPEDAGAPLSLRQCRADDLDLLTDAVADMLREEILDDPYARDPLGFRAQVWRMIREGSIWVLEAGGRVVFKAHASVRTPLAAQVSGVYTLPAYRGRGYARAGMAALARRLLEAHPLVSLYVNSENEAAVRAYEAVGFAQAGTFKSVFFARA
jgi:hypothetical protein